MAENIPLQNETIFKYEIFKERVEIAKLYINNIFKTVWKSFYKLYFKLRRLGWGALILEHIV